MFPRALLLLLLVLNVGVAAWWLLRPEPPVVEAPPPAAPRLQLVGETTAAARRPASSATASVARGAAVPAPTPMPATAASVPATAPGTSAMRCVRLGPFASDDALVRARSALQPRVARLAVTTVPASSRGWRVWLAPLADRDAAQAMAARIGAAGFSDYYVVPDGADANSIALGRYGNEDAARRRLAQLQAAGFAAQAEAMGVVTRWIDVATAATDDAALRADSGAAQSRALDCARLH
jgi:hypothetical protein